ncbi:MAG: 16S rRNA (guanine(966)-N(2))-methyltransferase RsmD [Pseudomonadota bacterium]
MRIVGGKFKGRSLVTPAGRHTRPTSDRAREAIFNVLAHAEWAPPIEGARVMDIFAGSGALGLEALSRGAEFCLFVEMATPALRAIGDNVDAFNLTDVTRLRRRSADALGDFPEVLGEPFNLVFMDPPYGKGLVLPALTALSKGGWLTQDAVVMVEMGKGEPFEEDGWCIEDQRGYGAACVRFIRPLADV